MIELKPHQQKAVDELSNGKILYGGVGTGKTITSLAYFYTKVCGGVLGDPASMRSPRDIVVITTAMKRDSLDWQKEAAQFSLGRDREASIHGISLTVDSWNNIAKYKEMKDAFFIFDEQRLVGSGNWTKSFVHIAKHNQWILLSATPGDTWLDYIPVFVANGWYKNRTEFKRRHVVYNTYGPFPKVDRYVEVGRLVRLRNQILVEMPYERHTQRLIEHIYADYDRSDFERVVKDRWHVYENRPLKDVGELFRVMRKVVNSDPSRLSQVRTLLEKHPKLIVFYNFDYELDLLRSLTYPNTSSSLRSKLPNSKKISSNGSGSTRSVKELSTSSTSVRADTGGDVLVRTTLPSTDPSIPERSGSTTGGRSRTRLSDPGRDSHTLSTKQEVMTSPSLSEKYSTSYSSGESFAIAEWNGHKHEPIPKTDRWLYLVQYTAGAEGWNCIETDAMAFFSLTYSWKQFWQAQGRIDRMNTPFSKLYYYVISSKSQIDRAIWRSLRNKQNFNEKRFAT